MTDDVCTERTCEHYGKPDGGIHRTEFVNDRPNPYRVPSAAVRRAWQETVAWEELRNREYPVDTAESRKDVR